MEIIFLNKYARKFKRYFIISILFFLIVSNDLVLSKGGGKGGKSGGSKGGSSGDDVDVSKNKISSSDKTSYPSGNHSSKSSSWVFFYSGGNGQRSCGNLCILTAVLVPTIILFIIGCGIWRCYRIRKRNRTDKIKNKIEADENDTNSYNSDSTTSPYYPPPVATPYNSPYYNSPTYYSTPKNDFNYTQNYLDGNYTNYAPGHNKLSPPPMELNHVKSSSRRESFDSMDEVRKNKK
ncbi:hypothetical protein C1646_711069 [Rhizophagus diaphanus]|nr:hypothetical protein C1646_711069 [Rhizophagus diaphanus] [Rhizophagus sp. MUCL 43196]